MIAVTPVIESITWERLERLAAEGPTAANVEWMKAVLAALDDELPQVVARARAEGRPMLTVEAWLARRAADGRSSQVG